MEALLFPRCVVLRRIGNTSPASFSRRRPDILTEELVLFLGKGTSFEFKQLFDLIFVSLRARNSLSGGEEMARLRVYEKLQGLVGQGVVKKTITSSSKTYKGVSGPLLALSAQLKSFRQEWTTRNPHAPVAT